jgi:hypothetical protein
VMFPYVTDELLLAQTLRVAINQKNFVAPWRERFQQEHPKVRHEVVGDFVVRVIEKNIH